MADPPEVDCCIVCLSALRTTDTTDRSSDAADAEVIVGTAATEGGGGSATGLDGAKTSSSTLEDNNQSLHEDPETIAHLLPCNHELHEVCLKPWVERANSCPSCRTTFNEVHLSRYRGGPVEQSYAVDDKKQEAEIDPAMIVAMDELYAVETWEPCAVCGNIDGEQETMHCDGCDHRVHVFCSGLDEASDAYYCANCIQNLENDGVLPRLTRSGRNTRRPIRYGHRATEWDRIWTAVHQNTDLDLDFPHDDDESSELRTDVQRIRIVRRQRREHVASGRGRARLQAINNPRIVPTAPRIVPDPESQDNLRAWNAFDRAQTLNETEPPAQPAQRKRKGTASPASPSEGQPTEQPLKRPRLRQRQRPAADTTGPMVESSNAAAQRNAEGPGFLSSLLKEVERQPMTTTTSASSPAGSDGGNGQLSPVNSPRALSPMPSSHATPRGMSVTPPPHNPSSPPVASTLRPSSPTPLTSHVLPAYAYDVTKHYQRNRERDNNPNNLTYSPDRGRQLPLHQQRPRAASSSPSRYLDLTAKQSIQSMVIGALKPLAHANRLSTEQYTSVNRDVSRKMYALVTDASTLSDATQKGKLQTAAEEEVGRMVASLSNGANSAGAEEEIDGFAA